MDYSVKVKELRENLLLTQGELAKKLGVSYVTVCRWENRDFEPTMKTKRKIIEVCKKNNIKVEDK